jgi:hypothetical protein
MSMAVQIGLRSAFAQDWAGLGFSPATKRRWTTNTPNGLHATLFFGQQSYHRDNFGALIP